MAPGSFLLDMLNRSKEQGELVAETETRSAVFVARRPSVRARMASCPFDDPPSWWMVKKCVPDQKIVTRWEGDGEEAYEVPLPVEVQAFLAMYSLKGRGSPAWTATMLVLGVTSKTSFFLSMLHKGFLCVCCISIVAVKYIRLRLYLR